LGQRKGDEGGTAIHITPIPVDEMSKCVFPAKTGLANNKKKTSIINPVSVMV
jgi:hypothetical protein